MNNSLIVKQATIEDLEEVSKLFNEYRVFYNQESDLDGARNFLFERFEHRESIIFLALDTESNNAVGFTQLYPVFSSVSMKRSWILNDLYVYEAYRKLGAAKLLLEMVKTYAIQTKAKGIELSTAINNDIAQRLYEKNEYTKNMDFYNYYLDV